MSFLTTSPTIAVFERSLLLYKRLWRASVFGSLLLPVLTLISIGIGVGGYVGDIDGVGYLAWITPGVLASVAFQIGVGESTYPVLGNFKWTRAFHAMAATPVRTVDMVGGQLMWVLVRTEVAVVSFLAVTALFGALRSPWSAVTPLICGLLAVAGAAPTTAFSAWIDNDGYFALVFRFVLIPSTLFAGVFFPVARLPAAMRPLAYLSPLWHAVELSRAATLGRPPPWPIPVHVGYLLAWAAAGIALAWYAFRRRLTR
ncbi:MAG TPA: ABC transporter permease [Streptosporangiaceae bacterium]|jgi:lipooligosaccharide transport system permease protein